MEKKEIKLSEFLKVNGAYEKFVKNLDIVYFNNETFDGKVTILNAFYWDDSLEGYEYWDELDDRWEEFDNDLKVYDMNWLLEDIPLITNEKQYYYNNFEKFELCTRKAHQTHYIKWKLTDNLSLRYFYSFQDNLDFIGKFVLKNHSKKESVIISKDTAKELLEFVKEDFEEIIGYLEKDEYRKLVLVGGDIKNISVLINDKVAL